MIALITTTIYVPRVLEWYRAIDPDVRIYVVGDTRTPHDEVRKFTASLGNAVYYSDDDQRKLGYHSSEALGWQVPARRSIGMLEAVREGADVLVTIDDDNIPLNDEYFQDFSRVLSRPFSGLRANHTDRWFDAGVVMDPPVHHRGFPHELWHRSAPLSVEPVVGAKVGVAAGLWLGDPDIDAVTRLANRPQCLAASPVQDSGFVVSCNGYSPFNSQNTAFVRDLLPAMVMLSTAGRYDDIWASYIAERVMREFDMCVHYGRPLVWQERNPHMVLENLRAELLGMGDTLEFTKTLDDIDTGSDDIVSVTARIYEGLARSSWRNLLADIGRAWVRDAEQVLSAA